VMSIELAPGVEPTTVLGFITSGGISAMVFKSLGEGNVCSEGEFNLLPLIRQATEEYATPILLTTKFVGGSAASSKYETGLRAVEAGAVPCYDHTDVAADVKARWLLGNAICADVEGFRKAMARSYAGEMTERE
jgi:L-asparaginase/Glu-tRNA(Gln) amidotransferase subunit D